MLLFTPFAIFILLSLSLPLSDVASAQVSGDLLSWDTAISSRPNILQMDSLLLRRAMNRMGLKMSKDDWSSFKGFLVHHSPTGVGARPVPTLTPADALSAVLNRYPNARQSIVRQREDATLMVGIDTLLSNEIQSVEDNELSVVVRSESGIIENEPRETMEKLSPNWIYSISVVGEEDKMRSIKLEIFEDENGKWVLIKGDQTANFPLVVFRPAKLETFKIVITPQGRKAASQSTALRYGLLIWHQ